MLCPDCKDLYIYDHTLKYWHSGKEIECGWILKTELEEEKNYKQDVENKAKELYYDLWRRQFEGLKTKKQIWIKLTLKGRYYPTESTFYKHTKGYSLILVSQYVDRFFNYSELKRVFEICGVSPDWITLRANKEDIDRFQPRMKYERS